MELEMERHRPPTEEVQLELRLKRIRERLAEMTPEAIAKLKDEEHRVASALQILKGLEELP